MLRYRQPAACLWIKTINTNLHWQSCVLQKYQLWKTYIFFFVILYGRGTSVFSQRNSILLSSTLLSWRRQLIRTSFLTPYPRLKNEHSLTLNFDYGMKIYFDDISIIHICFDSECQLKLFSCAEGIRYWLIYKYTVDSL